jgi:hypothetical protein
MELERYAWMALKPPPGWHDTQTLTIIPVRYRSGHAVTVPWSGNPGPPREGPFQRYAGKARRNKSQVVVALDPAHDRSYDEQYEPDNAEHGSRLSRYLPATPRRTDHAQEDS